ncbi:MAG: PadR family transcriptional regulator [Propionibacteriaceae bacterium]|jgi:DNA-binding PadR family transcriptional regulator|nr:PadR family transcriptional regulator [Propionibacteriaceae bacterium]
MFVPDERPPRCGRHHRHHHRCGFDVSFDVPLPPDPMGRGGFIPPAVASDFGFSASWGFGPWPRGRRRAKRGLLRESILVLLQERPRNGYQIISTLADRTMGAWQPSPGAVYPCLQQLTDEGLIQPIDLDGQKAFELTELGRTAVQDVPGEPWAAENDHGRPGQEWPAFEIRSVFDELKQLAKALRLVATDADADQLKSIAADIAALRRKLYASLAQDPEADD